MKNLLTAVLLLLPVLGNAQSRPLATCDQKVRIETRGVNPTASVQFFPPPAITNGAYAADNSSGSWISESRERCLFNNDASNLVYVSTFPLTSMAVDSAKAWPIPASSYKCFSWGAWIPTWLSRAVGSGSVTGSNCK